MTPTNRRRLYLGVIRRRAGILPPPPELRAAMSVYARLALEDVGTPQGRRAIGAHLDAFTREMGVTP